MQQAAIEVRWNTVFGILLSHLSGRIYLADRRKLFGSQHELRRPMRRQSIKKGPRIRIRPVGSSQCNALLVVFTLLFIILIIIIHIFLLSSLLFALLPCFAFHQIQFTGLFNWSVASFLNLFIGEFVLGSI